VKEEMSLVLCEDCFRKHVKDYIALVYTKQKRCSLCGQPAYFEVVCPELSEANPDITKRRAEASFLRGLNLILEG